MLVRHQLKALTDMSVLLAFHNLLYAQTGFLIPHLWKNSKYVRLSIFVVVMSLFLNIIYYLFIVSRTKKKIFKSTFDFALTDDVKSEAIFS